MTKHNNLNSLQILGISRPLPACRVGFGLFSIYQYSIKLSPELKNVQNARIL